jgi:hypothetical protein
MNNVSVVYRDILYDSIRDISISVSKDNGSTFGQPVNFSEDKWQLDGCPHNGPAIVANEELNYTAWFTGGQPKGVYYAELDKIGRTQKRKLLSSSGRHVQLSLFENHKPILAYNEMEMKADSMYSKVVVVKIEKDQAYRMEITRPGSNAGFPVIQRIGADRFAVAWSDRGQVFYAIVNAGEIKEAMPDMGILSGENDDDSSATVLPPHVH